MLEDFAKLIAWIIPLIVLAVIILAQTIRILREYERGVIFRLGKLLGTKGPGMIFLIPVVDRMVRMDLRVVTIDVARQELMTRDNVPMTVDGNPPGALSLIPEPKLDDPSKLKRSLRKLLDYDFDVLLLCDGQPVLRGGKLKSPSF